jgi:ech hydrogenase subunit B
MTVTMIVRALLYILLAPFIGALLSGLDRVFSARMQGRVGPPLIQPLYDVNKLLNKQTTVVNSIQVLFVTVYLVFTIFTGTLFFAGGDMLLVFFALSMSEVMLVLAAFSTNGPYSIMGAQRELLQMMCYEPMTLLVAIGFYYANGSFMVNDLIHASVPAIVQIPGFFIGFVFILIIKLRKSPFDLSTSHHMHQEMVKGLTTDLSGGNLARVEIAEWYDTVLMMGIVGMFFITNNPISILWAVIACSVVFFLETLIDNLFPRV